MAIGKCSVKSDLHCHILPSIDDGAKNLDASNALLSMEASQGISQITFTPHFYPDRITLDEFLEKRKKAYESLAMLSDEYQIDFNLGAEVHMHQVLNELDFNKLCFFGTNYLLLEWPMTTYPLWGKDIVESMLSEGITPIFAHIERYDYFRENLDNLEEYIDMGCLCQMNADTVVFPQTQKFALKLIKQNYIHIISSDAHSINHRPPRLDEAYEIIEKKLDTATLQRILSNANNIFNGNAVENTGVTHKKLFSFFK